MDTVAPPARFDPRGLVELDERVPGTAEIDGDQAEIEQLDGPVLGAFLTGVACTGDTKSLKVYHGGKKYVEWEFIWNPLEDAAAAQQQQASSGQGGILGGVPAGAGGNGTGSSFGSSPGSSFGSSPGNPGQSMQPQPQPQPQNPQQ